MMHQAIDPAATVVPLDTIGAVLRRRRKQLGYTLARLSESSGVALGYISQIELGKNSASIETLWRLTRAMGMSISSVFQEVGL